MTAPALNLEEEILIASGLLDYEPTNDEDESTLTEEQQGLEDHEIKALLPADEAAKIFQQARDAYKDLPGRLGRYSWPGATWEVGKSVPGEGNENLLLFGMFTSASEKARMLLTPYVNGDIRAYAAPKDSRPGDSYVRYTINRLTPGTLKEPLTKDAFVAEVGSEFAELLAIVGGDECPSCEERVMPDYEFCPNCGEELGEEEPEEPEEKPADPPQVTP